MFAFFPLLIPRNYRHKQVNSSRCFRIKGTCSLFYLFENVVKARPLVRIFIPTFVHQTETLGGSFIHGNHRSAQRRGVLQMFHNF